jgi:hypothetical protein
MKQTLGNFGLPLPGVTLAVATIAVGFAGTAKEETVTVHSFVPKAALDWTKSEDPNLLWVIRLSLEIWNREEHQKYLAGYDDPRSADYRKALSDEEYQRRFGPPRIRSRRLPTGSPVKVLKSLNPTYLD